jgi:hypothetical protein
MKGMYGCSTEGAEPPIGGRRPRVRAVCARCARGVRRCAPMCTGAEITTVFAQTPTAHPSKK